MTRKLQSPRAEDGRRRKRVRTLECRYEGFLCNEPLVSWRMGKGLDHGMFPDVNVSQALSSHFVFSMFNTFILTLNHFVLRVRGKFLRGLQWLYNPNLEVFVKTVGRNTQTEWTQFVSHTADRKGYKSKRIVKKNKNKGLVSLPGFMISQYKYFMRPTKWFISYISGDI